MRTLTVTLSVVFCFAASLNTSNHAYCNVSQTGQPDARRAPAGTKQLFAVRGEVVKMGAHGKGMLALTIRPSGEFSEVTVVARENDMVGSAARSERGADLLGLITGTDDAHDSERITAAELQTGDIVSVIYDPQTDNRALEIYIH